MHPKYRPDIDGLRAIAVLSVVGFHAFPFWVLGGLIGVDIFFVISGFLISTIIFGSLERNSFSFFSFYSHRIKRIFPALLLVLIASYAFGWFALFPDEYKQLGKHIAGGAGFVSNFFLLNENGYFDAAADTKPFLHLWSLGIEEQFYIIWPLLLWSAWKWRLNLLTITIAVGVISFALNIREINHDAAAAFYSPQTRFWELSLGSVLAYMMPHRRNLSSTIGNFNVSILSLLGAVLIAASILAVSKDRAFPGWWAVLPTAGAALIISAGPQAWLNRVVLSHRALVWIGLISYPLYLWHWPLLSFAHIVSVEYPSRNIRISTVLVSILLAWLTQKLIEKPIRSGKASKVKSIALIALMSVVGIVGYHTYDSDGFKFRMASSSQFEYGGDIGSKIYFDYMRSHFHFCTPTHIREEASRWTDGTDDMMRCFQSKEDGPIQIAIIGDSQAEHLFTGLAEKLPEKNVAYYIGSDAVPVLNNNDSKTFEYVISDKNITTVIISVYWPRYQENHPELKNELLETVSKLVVANKKVYIVDGIPDFLFDPINCKYERPNGMGKKRTCIQDRSVFDQRYQKYYPIFREVAKTETKIEIINTTKYFCDTKYCSMEKDYNLLYRDRTHLNIIGSKYLAAMILKDTPQLRY